jgi:hypothetical protein
MDEQQSRLEEVAHIMQWRYFLLLRNRNRDDSTSPLDRILDQPNEVTTLTFLCF